MPRASSIMLTIGSWQLPYRLFEEDSYSGTPLLIFTVLLLSLLSFLLMLLVPLSRPEVPLAGGMVDIFCFEKKVLFTFESLSLRLPVGRNSIKRDQTEVRGCIE